MYLANLKLLTFDRFLLCKTPKEWLNEAKKNLPILLIDHANCEKKAASTACSLLFRYINFPELLHKLSPLAREELLHFEQVLEMMEAYSIQYTHVGASRYAQGLWKHVSGQDPRRLVDILIIGAIIEARSCERFYALAEEFSGERLGNFYEKFAKAEERHFIDYLSLCNTYVKILKNNKGASERLEQEVESRIQLFLEIEEHLIQSSDDEFRFHSGIPARSDLSCNAQTQTALCDK